MAWARVNPDVAVLCPDSWRISVSIKYSDSDGGEGVVVEKVTVLFFFSPSPRVLG